jgi:hypothetical protein
MGSALAAGFASSGLRVVESSHKPWVNDRVWLSLNKILAQNARKRLDVGRNKKTYDTLDFANKVRSRFLFLVLHVVVPTKQHPIQSRTCGSSTSA